MNYFFVFQGESYEEELRGQYIWAPQYTVVEKTKKRITPDHWTRMKEVRKDDIIIHCSKKNIRAISIAKDDCHESERPKEKGYDKWKNEGWRVNTKYYTFKKCIVSSENMNALYKFQPDEGGPFDINKKGKVGYLYKTTKEMFEYIVKETAKIQDTLEETNKVLNLLEFDDEYINNQKDKELLDDIANEIIEKNNLKENFEFRGKPQPKQKPINTGGRKVYPRKKQTSLNALSHANYKCEVDITHKLFLRKRGNTYYTEPHHLVPMKYSEQFEVSLDVEENIVSLCSHCHNLIHYGKDAKEVLHKLYNERKSALEKVGIIISFEELLKMYNI